MRTPRHSFFSSEGRVLKAALWGTAFLFFAIMIATWVAAERAHPVMLDLTTGQPMKHRPPL